MIYAHNKKITASPSTNKNLGACTTVVYSLSADQQLTQCFTGDIVILLVKTRGSIFPTSPSASHLFKEEDFYNPRMVPLRIMSACITGCLGDLMCDCYDDMVSYLSQIAKNEEGIFVYLPQEGLGRGLRFKISDHRLQAGFDESGSAIMPLTFTEATTLLAGSDNVDQRDYSIVENIFSDLGLKSLSYLWLGSSRRALRFFNDTDLSRAYAI